MSAWALIMARAVWGTRVAKQNGTGRLGFKPHLKAHVLSETEVALIAETERFALRGRPYALLAPLLDGTRSADEIVMALQRDVAPELTYCAMNRLETGGFIIALPEHDRAEQRDPWHMPAASLGSDRAVGAQQPISIVVIGLPDAVSALLGEKLRAAAPSDQGAQKTALEVCLVDDYLRPELAARVARVQETGGVLLPVRPAGHQIWLGPLIEAETAPVWTGLDKRMRNNRPADVAVLSRDHPFPIVPIKATPDIWDLGLSLTATIAARCAAGNVPEAIDGCIWTIDTGTLGSRRHAIPTKWCALDDEGAPHRALPRRIELPPNPKQFTADGGHRTCTPEETLARLEPLVSPITGVIRSIEKSVSPAGIHLFIAGQTWPGQRITSRQSRLLGLPSGAGGKGQTEIQARVSCIAEAVERFSCGYFGDEPTVTGSLDALGPDAIHPNDIMLFSDDQYAGRLQNNETRQEGRSYSWVPEPFDVGRTVGWTPVWSLSKQRERLVPNALCYFGYHQSVEDTEHHFARTNSNGCAAGNTLPEAVLQGLLELVERDACALWWYNRVRRPAIDLKSFGDPYFDAMSRRFDGLGRCLYVLDLRTDIGLPVAMAVSWRNTDGGHIHLGLGCHLEPRLAISRALTELTQVAFSEEWETLLESGNKTYDLDHLHWLRTATTNDQRYVVPQSSPVMEASDMTDFSSDDISEDIRFCVRRLNDLGLETLVLDHTRPDVGFPTARVIVPGLRHFWARLAPGRLYDVPVALSWQARAQPEAALNPMPFFL